MLSAVVAAFVYHYSYRMQLHRGLDDAVNAVPVHFYCGIWGLFSAALMFAPGRHDTLMRSYGVDESRGSCGRGDQVAANMAFAAVVVLWVSGCCARLGLGLCAHAASPMGQNNQTKQQPAQWNNLRKNCRAILK